MHPTKYACNIYIYIPKEAPCIGNIALFRMINVQCELICLPLTYLVIGSPNNVQLKQTNVHPVVVKSKTHPNFACVQDTSNANYMI